MVLRMPVVWSDRHRGHAPGIGYWLGVPIAADEEPERGDLLRDALAAHAASIVAPTEHGDGPLERVHDRAFVEFLATAHARWVAEGHLDDPGQPLVVPYVFALPQLTSGRPPHPPSAIRAIAGQYAIDTMTLIGAGTYDAARAAVDCALTACDLVLGGATAAYAAIRPPGHHVGRDFYGGACYLNNAACAAQYLRDHGADRVAIIDIDAHHGNGTQEIFYERPDVWFGSLHVDPGAGWFPHFVGFADEGGAGNGVGFNLNVPLAETTGNQQWLGALTILVEAARSFDPSAVVVSLGVDTAREDPNSPFGLDAETFALAGAQLTSLQRPTVLVQEGGYVPAVFTDHVLAVLEGFEAAP